MPDIAEVIVDVKQKQTIQSLNKIQNKLTSIGRNATAAGKTFFAAWGFNKAIEFLKKMGDASKDFQTTMNRFDAVFTKFNSNANKGVKELVDYFHQTERSAKKLISLIGSRLSDSLSFSDKGKMAREMAKMSENLSITFGYDVQIVSQKLNQGLTGMTRGLKDLGIIIDTTTPAFKKAVQELQLSKGISQQAAKAQAIYNEYLKQTSKYNEAFGQQSRSLPQALGDIWNTLYSNLLEKTGKVLSKILVPILQKLNQLLQSPVLGWLGSLFLSVSLLGVVLSSLATVFNFVIGSGTMVNKAMEDLTRTLFKAALGSHTLAVAIEKNILGKDSRMRFTNSLRSELRGQFKKSYDKELLKDPKKEKRTFYNPALLLWRNLSATSWVNLGKAMADSYIKSAKIAFSSGETISAVANIIRGSFLKILVGFGTFLIKISAFLFLILKGILVGIVFVLANMIGRAIYNVFANGLSLDFWKKVCDSWLPAAYQAIKDFGSAVWNYLVHGTFKSNNSVRTQSKNMQKTAKDQYASSMQARKQYSNSITGITYSEAQQKIMQNLASKARDVANLEAEYNSSLRTAQRLSKSGNIKDLQLSVEKSKQAAQAAKKLKDVQQSRIQSLKQLATLYFNSIQVISNNLDLNDRLLYSAEKLTNLQQRTTNQQKMDQIRNLLADDAARVASGDKNKPILSVQQRRALYQKLRDLQIKNFELRMNNLNRQRRLLQESLNFVLEKINQMTQYRAKGTDAIDMNTMQGYKYADSAYGDLSQYNAALTQINTSTLALDQARNQALNEIQKKLAKIQQDINRNSSVNITSKP